MKNYCELFDETMNSLELSSIYYTELLKCETQEKCKALWDAYDPIRSKVFMHELEYNAEHGIMTEY